MNKPQVFATVVARKEKISSKVYELDLKLTSPQTIQFLAGQTVMMRIAPSVNRSMSIVSPPAEQSSIRLWADISPMGPGSRWTLNAKVGDPLTVVGPLGMFVLDAQSPRKKVLVATGTGIAPFRGMLYDYEARGMRQPVSLYWGLRREEDLFWQDELNEFLARHPNVSYTLTLSQPSDSWAGNRGRVTAYIYNEEGMKDCEWYLCGNRTMVDEVHTELLARGVPKEQIKKELFY